MEQFKFTLIHVDDQDNPVYQDVVVEAESLNAAIREVDIEYPEAVALLF